MLFSRLLTGLPSSLNQYNRLCELHTRTHTHTHLQCVITLRRIPQWCTINGKCEEKKRRRVCVRVCVGVCVCVCVSEWTGFLSCRTALWATELFVEHCVDCDYGESCRYQWSRGGEFGTRWGARNHAGEAVSLLANTLRARVYHQHAKMLTIILLMLNMCNVCPLYLQTSSYMIELDVQDVMQALV